LLDETFGIAIPRYLSAAHDGRALDLDQKARLRQTGDGDECARGEAFAEGLLPELDEAVAVTMSAKPLPPDALMFLSMSAKIARTCWSKPSVGAAVCPASHNVLPPSVVTTREKARCCARSSGA
jgi:hypothetical protein